MEKIKELLSGVAVPRSGFCLKKEKQFYWGKDSEGDIVYGIESRNKELLPMLQSTKYLRLYLNTVFDVVCNGDMQKNNFSLVVLKKDGVKFLDIFIRLTASIDSTLTDQELLDYFLSLKNLFSNDSKKSIKELQGLYGELYFMVYLKEKCNIDIAKYYQSEDKRKFDFSISDSKKIEIKTTVLPVRIHHFRLGQLNTFRYDIIVASIMLQEDDQGMSLIDLIDRVRIVFSNNLKFMIHIENMIKNIEKDVLELIRYSKKYVEDNIKIFNAVDVPRIREKTMDGIFNVEFDSDLSSLQCLEASGLTDWLCNRNK